MPGVKGQLGHVPKRSDQRRRRNKVDIDRVELDEVVEVPALDLEHIHPLAEDFYNSLKRSGQARYYEPSDWQRARILTHMLSDVLCSGKPSAMMYSAIQKDMETLLVSEGDRRRLRMEIERAPADTSAEDELVAQMDRYRKMAQGA